MERPPTPPIEPALFRHALGQFASGVTVLTTRGPEDRPLGMTVSAFCSVSLEPPLVLACVDVGAEAQAGLRSSRLFGVSVLAEDQEELSRRFAVPGPGKFEAGGLVPGRTGVLLVEGALAQLECRVVALHEAGDHTICVGEVVHLRAGAGRPLLHHASAYGRLAGE